MVMMMVVTAPMMMVAVVMMPMVMMAVMMMVVTMMHRRRAGVGHQSRGDQERRPNGDRRKNFQHSYSPGKNLGRNAPGT
jgi:hypothetical protein